MIEPRIYRAAFLPTLFAVVVAMFSLESRPAPLPQGLAADVLFDGEAAAATMTEIAERWPDRSPGSTGNAAVADLVARQFSQAGFDPVVRRRFEADGKRLENIVARKPGATRDQIVVAAARDTIGGGPDAVGTAADTGALLELARIFEGRAAEATIVLASLDGSSAGDAGAERLLETVREQGPVRGIVVLSNVAASRSRGSLVVQWSNDASRGSIGLHRTAVVSLRQELGGVPGDDGWLGQIARLAFPIGVGAQGVLVDERAPAVRISGSGELPPPEDARGVDDADVDRLGRMGRGVLRTATALDGAREPQHGPDTYVIAARNVVPGWALALLAAVLLIPPLVASVDAVARARRRKQPLLAWWAWTLAAAAPFVIGFVVAWFLGLVQQAPDAPPAPPPPSAFPFGGGAALSLGLTAAAVLIAWLLVRPLLARRAGGAGSAAASPGARAATALALSVAGVVAWFANPFAALVLAPAVHFWMLAMVADARRGPSVALLAAGLIGPAGVAIYYMARLGLDPLEALWYLFLLVTGGHVSVPTALFGAALLALFTAVVAVVAARLGEDTAPPPSGPRLRGPASYRGPGSLGGTKSALGSRR